MNEPTNGRHAYSCCDSPRGCAWPDRHTQPCTLHHGCGASHGVTEQPNTAEIRDRWAAWNPAPMAPGGTILALCDALDAARAELSDQERWTARANANTLEQRLRAEAAERQVAAIEALAVRYAEAGRAAPLYPHVDSGRAWHWVAIDIRSALAGETS